MNEKQVIFPGNRPYVMRCLLILAVSIFISCIACNKNEHDCSDVVRPVSVSKTVTPDTVTTGQSITSRLSVYFYEYFGQKLNTITVSLVTEKYYNIEVTAKYRGCESPSLPYIWSYDTTVSIPTSVRGIYILRFAGTDSSLYDTVQVID